MKNNRNQLYNELVFRISNRTFHINDLKDTEPFTKQIIETADKQKGFLLIDEHGGIKILNPVETLCYRLIAYGKYLAYFIKADGQAAAIQMPMKETMSRQNVPMGIHVDNSRLNETLKKAGIKPMDYPVLQKLEDNVVRTTIREITPELNTEWIHDAMRNHCKPKLVLMNRIFNSCLPDGLTKIDETITEQYASQTAFTDCDAPIQKIFSGNTLQDIVREYNTKVILRIVLGETITEFPKDSDAVSLALTFVKYIPAKTDSTWEKYNVTETIRQEALDKTDIMRAVTSIKRPSFERIPGNTNTKTFDQIRIRLGIVGKNTMPGRNSRLRQNQKDLARIALGKIKDNKIFQRYGIPVNVLKLDRMTITCQDELELIFVLKDLP